MTTSVPPTESKRLRLVSMSPQFLAALLDGRREAAEGLLGAELPLDWPGRYERFLRLRLEQMQRDPSVQRWLARAMVLRHPDSRMVGTIGFHDAPDERGGVEVGYSVQPEYRRRGYATEAVGALLEWAFAEQGIARFVASVRPDNEPSLRLIANFGFRRTGKQWDEEDGEELVFELVKQRHRGS